MKLSFQMLEAFFEVGVSLSSAGVELAAWSRESALYGVSDTVRALRSLLVTFDLPAVAKVAGLLFMSVHAQCLKVSLTFLGVREPMLRSDILQVQPSSYFVSFPAAAMLTGAQGGELQIGGGQDGSSACAT
jgi:hypothetical protein